MFSRKNGFTLAELITVLTIIGILLIIELAIIQNRKNQYGGPYYAAYNALKKASYNILADMYCPDPDSEDPECRRGPRPYPKITSTTPDASIAMCERLKEFINVSKNDLGSCEATPINDAANNIFDANGNDEASLKFVGSNSFRFYISNMKTKTLDSGETIEYFIVYVDINGKEKPNRINMTENDTIYPDIVPFILTRKGDAIPAGYPIYSRTYLTAKVKYPESSEEGTMVKKHSPSMTFFEAKTKAWGEQPADERIDIPLGISFDDELLTKGTAATFYSNKLTTIKSSLNAALDGGEGCKPQTYNCRVLIDEGADARY